MMNWESCCIDQEWNGWPVTTTQDFKDIWLFQGKLLSSLTFLQDCVNPFIDIVGIGKFCGTWVPGLLTAKMKAPGTEIYKNEGEETLHSVVTANETWPLHYAHKHTYPQIPIMLFLCMVSNVSC